MLGGRVLGSELVVPDWMRGPITAAQYATWTADQSAGIEIVGGLVLVAPNVTKRQNRLARILANALDAAAGPEWNADTGLELRLQDEPLNSRRPDVTLYRAETIDITPTRPEHVLLVVDAVSPGSDIGKANQYAQAGIQFYWRVEHTTPAAPLVYTYVLDPASRRYREAEIFTGAVNLTAPFLIEIDLGQI